MANAIGVWIDWSRWISLPSSSNDVDGALSIYILIHALGEIVIGGCCLKSQVQKWSALFETDHSRTRIEEKTQYMPLRFYQKHHSLHGKISCPDWAEQEVCQHGLCHLQYTPNQCHQMPWLILTISAQLA